MTDIVEDISDRLDTVNDKYIKQLEKLLEEMVNAPREEYKRQPGERGKYETYRMERKAERAAEGTKTEPVL